MIFRWIARWQQNPDRHQYAWWIGKEKRNAPAAAAALREQIVRHGKDIMRQTMLVMAGCVDSGDRHSIAGSEGPIVHSPRFPPETN